MKKVFITAILAIFLIINGIFIGMMQYNEQMIRRQAEKQIDSLYCADSIRINKILDIEKQNR